MSKRVRVHHFVVANLVRPESNLWLASDLFHVSYWLDVPADTEFPYIVPRLQVFARFDLRKTPESEFRIRLVWDDPSRDVEVLLLEAGPYTIPAARVWLVHDRSFNLHNIHLRGVGLHTVQLQRLKRFSGGYAEWITVRETYFYVEPNHGPSPISRAVAGCREADGPGGSGRCVPEPDSGAPP